MYILKNYCEDLWHLRNTTFGPKIGGNRQNNYLNNKYKRPYLHYYAFLVYLSFRFLFAGICVLLNDPISLGIFARDPVMSLIARLVGEENRLIAGLFLVLSPIPITSISFHYFVFYATDKVIVSHLFDLVAVRNISPEIINNREREIKFQNAIPHLIFVWWRIIKQRIQKKIQRFRVVGQPRYFTSLTDRDRKIVSRIWIQFEVSYKISLFLDLAFIIGYSYLHLRDAQNLTWELLTILDLCCAVILVESVVKNGLFNVMANILLSFALDRELSQIGSILDKIAKSKSKTNSLAYYRALRRYRMAHCRTTSFIMRADLRLVSKPLLCFLLGNICFNSYSFVLLLYAKIENNFRILLAHVLFLEIVYPLIEMFFLSYVNRLICATTSMLFRALLYARFNRSQFDYYVRVSEHWKSSTYFEQLNRSNNDIAFTAGLLGVISRRSILEFFLIYFAYMMVFSGKFIQKQ